MRVVALVGVLMFGLMDGFYDMTMDVWGDGGTGDSGQVQSFEGEFPPPPPPPSNP